MLRWMAQANPGRAAPNYRLLGALSVLLWLLPAAMISLSPRYQSELTFGVGYLPVYIQYFGVGLLVACAVHWLLARLGSAPRWAGGAALLLAWLLGNVAAATHEANERVAAALAPAWRDPRLNLELALQAGLADEVPDRSTLILANQYALWHDTHSAYFYMQHTGKLLNTVWTLSPERQSQAGYYIATRCASPGCAVYEIKDQCLDADHGWVFLSKLDQSAPESDKDPERRTTSQVRLFLRGGCPTPESSPWARFWVAGCRLGAGEAEAEHFAVPVESLHHVRQDRKGTIYALDGQAYGIQARSLEGFWTAAPLAVTYGEGFYPEERTQTEQWRWCGERGVLYLVNATAQSKVVRLSMTLSALEDATVSLESGLFDKRGIELEVRKTGTSVSELLRVDPGAHRVTLHSRADVTRLPGDGRTLGCMVKNLLLHEE
jgi:hypothetical protein